MIRELKKKQTKFGAIIVPYSADLSAAEQQALLALNDVAGFVFMHSLTPNYQMIVPADRYGLMAVSYKARPYFKQLIGHYLTQFRGDGLVAFINPTTRILSNAERLYDFVDKNRMERTYAFYVGDKTNPDMVGVSGSLVEHIYHALPDAMELGDFWLGWLSNWMSKTMFGGRFFDATGLIDIKVAAPAPVVEQVVIDVAPAVVAEPTVEALQAASDQAAEWDPPQPTEELEAAKAKAKRKPGRPKKQK